MDPASIRSVKRLLLFLVAVDVALCLVGFGWPALWFRLVHGADAADPQRFLQRTAAAWAAFLVLQVVAYRRFEREPFWLAVIAGVRWSDMFTDWTHAVVAPDMTWLGYALLLSASPVNVLAGVILIRAHAAATSPRAPRCSAGRRNTPR